MFLPYLFRGVSETASERGVTFLLVKQVYLVLLDATLSSSEYWKDTFVVMGHLIATLRDRIEFHTWDDDLLLKEGQGEIRSCNVQNS